MQTVVGAAAIVFAAADLAAPTWLGYDLTGVWWSPWAALVVGAALISRGAR